MWCDLQHNVLLTIIVQILQPVFSRICKKMAPRSVSVTNPEKHRLAFHTGEACVRKNEPHMFLVSYAGCVCNLNDGIKCKSWVFTAALTSSY